MEPDLSYFNHCMMDNQVTQENDLVDKTLKLEYNIGEYSKIY